MSANQCLLSIVLNKSQWGKSCVLLHYLLTLQTQIVDNFYFKNREDKITKINKTTK